MKNALAIIISFVLISSLSAQNSGQELILEKQTKEDLTHYALTNNTALNKKQNEKKITDNLHKSVSAEGEKSLMLGGVLSALIPGAGEFYAKSYLKAGIFLAVEAGLWLGYMTFQNKGDNQTENFRAYADQNWDIRQYARWLHDKVTGGGNINPNEPDLNTLRNQINVVEAANFSHQLPTFGSQQYYELIGKYQNFVTGWKDADYNNISAAVNYSDPNSYVNVKTGMFNSYAVDRQQANDYYNTSTKFITGVIINHVLSAGDAVWSVHMFNSNLKVKTGIRIHERFGGRFMERYSLPVANLSVQF